MPGPELTDRYGEWMGKVFLVGVWNGVSLMFADFVGHVRGLDVDDPERRSKGMPYKAYVLWLTFPPMILLFLGEPVWLILAYGVLALITLASAVLAVQQLRDAISSA